MNIPPQRGIAAKFNRDRLTVGEEPDGGTRQVQDYVLQLHYSQALFRALFRGYSEARSIGMLSISHAFGAWTRTFLWPKAVAQKASQVHDFKSLIFPAQ